MSTKRPSNPDIFSQLFGTKSERDPLFGTSPAIPGSISDFSRLGALAKALPSSLGPPVPGGLGLIAPKPSPRPQPPVWSADYTRNFLRMLLRRRPVLAEGRVLPKLDDLAVMEGRQIEAAFMYTDLDSFTKLVATQPAKMSFVLLQAFVELVSRITSHYGGVVVDCAGDRLLSVFYRPAKNLSEEPVHEAVTAAFWTQNMLQESAAVFVEKGIAAPSVGIGLDYGSAVVGCVGIRNNKRLMFLGNAANNAARLQDLAQAGETVLSYPVFLRKPAYMTDWQLSTESDEVHVVRMRCSRYFADVKEAPSRRCF